ncbi:hypothetical protein D0T84_08815 [Dysgonomonas sp. 521]|uniref:hypothetical protein n=1 Tax=Dysgonomonas sp. 521 TaxID=2302932 RepID=UPI0013D57E81|nr:hypothetical protein [Dysgonomonas sp. 521]NDV95017.1 hypothetical protein [Dysgonomonas sp. 521]
MKDKIICLLFVNLFCFSLISSAQNRQRIEKQIELDILEVTDNFLLKTLDSVIVKKKSPLPRGMYIHTLRIEEDSTLEVFKLIKVRLDDVELIERFDYLGIFYISNTPFLVKKGCNPCRLMEEDPKSDAVFRKTGNKKRFEYFVFDPQIIAPNEPTYWFFLYVYKGGLSEIVLPEFYISRLGFTPCE